MIEETVFTKEKIIKIIKDKYNIDVYRIEKLNRGSANLYSLNENKYILKEFQSKYTCEDINKEIIIINHLKKDRIPVPEYLKTLDDKYYFVYEGKVVTLQKYIDGYTIKSNTATYDQIMESAKYLGMIVKSLQNLDIELPESDLFSLYSDDTIEESANKLKKLLQKTSKEKEPQIYNDLTDKIFMLEHIKEKVNFKEMNYLSVMNTHGDYSVLQFIYKKGKINEIIDFVSACKMPVVWEIIRSYSYIDPLAKDGNLDINNLVQYVKEFTKYVKLNHFDIKYMPYLYLIQLLASTFGYKQYIADNSKKNLLDFAFFRTKLCKYLYENASIIAGELEKEIYKVSN